MYICVRYPMPNAAIYGTVNCELRLTFIDQAGKVPSKDKLLCRDKLVQCQPIKIIKSEIKSISNNTRGYFFII